MTDAPAAPARRSRAWRVWVIVAAAAIAVVGAIALLGGFNDVPIDELPITSVGSTHHGTEVDTVITAVYLASTVPGQTYAADEGTQYLLVEATMLNTKTTPHVGASELVRILIDGVVTGDDEPSTGPVDARNGSSTPFLQPGLPFDGAFAWEVPDTVKTGDKIVLGFFDKFQIYDDPLFGDTAKTPSTPTERIITTIGERP